MKIIAIVIMSFDPSIIIIIYHLFLIIYHIFLLFIIYFIYYPTASLERIVESSDPSDFNRVWRNDASPEEVASGEEKFDLIKLI